MWATCENKNKKRRVEQKELLNDKKRKFSEVETPKKKEYCKFKKANQHSFLIRERLYQKIMGIIFCDVSQKIYL